MAKFIKPKVFVSACIEFDACRYDGELIRDEYVKRLFDFVDVIRVCPELAIGLGSPRDAVRLVQRENEGVKLLSTNHGVDHTEKIVDFSASYLNKLKEKEVDGFILKAKSPTCGIKNVKLYRDIGKANVSGAKNDGFFGGKVLELFPGLPVETERRLSNFKIRDVFFTKLFTLSDFRPLKKDPKAKNLVAFHSKNKYLFMAYNQTLLRKMGNIVANHEHLKIETVFEQYEVLLQELLSKEPTQKKRINVLTHIYGYFKKNVEVEEKEYYFDVLDQYLNNRIPYSNVLTVLKGWAIRFKESYLMIQTVFEPYPNELIMVTDSGKKI